jgi:glutamine synthetase
MAYLDQLSQSLRNQEAVGLTPDRSLVTQLSELSQNLLSSCTQLEQAMHHHGAGVSEHLNHCASSLLHCMGAVREAVDGLEQLIDDGSWPLPTYQEMLFMR